jgi:hypothetical protein
VVVLAQAVEQAVLYQELLHLFQELFIQQLLAEVVLEQGLL